MPGFLPTMDVQMHNYTTTIEELLAAQDFLNAQYDCQEWRTKGHLFSDYIWIEAGELLNHDGSIFHYRKQVCDSAQVKLELVDILHFGLSVLLMQDAAAEAVANMVAGAEKYSGEAAGNLVAKYARDLAKAATKGKFDVFWFTKLCAACGFSFSEIAEAYFLKYTLNRFRIEHGQTRGEYTKVWADGREDNEHLMELAEEWDTEEDLYAALGARYAAMS
jgi:dimeric dUTPase (all-alpha-NTP-PPase superfamily)